MSKNNLILETFVAGLIYGDLDVSKLSKLKRGTKLKLTWEFDNLHDSNAVKLLLGKKKVGYIPREETSALHACRQQNAKFRCVVKQVAPSNPTHRAVLIEVYVIVGEPTTRDFRNY